MHVTSKKLAIVGLIAAFSAVMLILSAVIEMNSLFFIAAASFCVGIVIREWGLSLAGAFLIASTFVNLLVSPNKMYCITYAAMGLYLLLREAVWEWIARKPVMKQRRTKFLLGKYIVFNAIYIPVLIFLPQLVIAKEIKGMTGVLFFLAGQIGLFVYDAAYVYFQGTIWNKLRGKLLKE